MDKLGVGILETTIRLKSFNDWKEVAIPVDLPTLLKCRAICLKEFQAYLEKEKNTMDWGRLGFVPATFAEWWLQKSGIELPQGVDRMGLLYACYQKIQVMNEKGKWVTLPNSYIWPNSNPERR
jgi:hypothetical protein